MALMFGTIPAALPKPNVIVVGTIPIPYDLPGKKIVSPATSPEFLKQQTVHLKNILNIEHEGHVKSRLWGDRVDCEDIGTPEFISLTDIREKEYVHKETKQENLKTQELFWGGEEKQHLSGHDRLGKVENQVPKQVASSSVAVNEEAWPTLTSTRKNEIQKVASAAAKIREEELARAKAVEEERKKLLGANKARYEAENTRDKVNGRAKTVNRGMVRKVRDDYKITCPKPIPTRVDAGSRLEASKDAEKLVLKQKPKHQLAQQLMGIAVVEKNSDKLDKEKTNDSLKLVTKEEQEELEKRKMRNAKKMQKRAEKKLMEEKENKEKEDKEREDKERRKAKKKAAKKKAKTQGKLAHDESILETSPPSAPMEPEPEQEPICIMSKEQQLCKGQKRVRSLILLTAATAISATAISLIAWANILF